MTVLEKLPKPFFVLAPMDDVTDTVFRQIIADLAPPDLYITEFVNVDGLQSPGRLRLLHKLQFTSKEKPIFAQLWGLKPENFYKTVKEVKKMGFAGVDLNMGCPVKTVIKNGACAALINNRKLAEEIIDASREAARSTTGEFPLSIKTRVGFTTPDMSWIEFLLSKKLDMLSIHGRTAKQKSEIKADWDLIGEARKMRDSLCPTTLIVGNGDIASYQEALNLIKKYQLNGVMVGRGVFHNPLIFSSKSDWAKWDKRKKKELYRKHIELFAKTWKDGERRVETLNKFCKVYISGFDGASQMRTKFMSAQSAEQALELLKED